MKPDGSYEIDHVGTPQPEVWSPDGRIDFDEDDLVELTEDLFHVGQIYTNEPAAKIRCAICRGDKFEVGQDHCFTAIRCVSCRWEICIHNG